MRVLYVPSEAMLILFAAAQHELFAINSKAGGRVLAPWEHLQMSNFKLQDPSGIHSSRYLFIRS